MRFSSARVGCGTAVGENPVELKALDRFEELVEIDRLGHETVCPKLVTAMSLFIPIRGGQHNNRDGAQLLGFLDLFEDLDPADLWKANIEQDEARTAGLTVGASLEEVVERLFPVFHPEDGIHDLPVFKSLPNQIRMIGVVFHQEDLDTRHGLLPPQALCGSPTKVSAVGKKVAPGKSP